MNKNNENRAKVRLQVQITEDEYKALVLIKNFMFEQKVITSDSDYAFLKYIIQQFIVKMPMKEQK